MRESLKLAQKNLTAKKQGLGFKRIQFWLSKQGVERLESLKKDGGKTTAEVLEAAIEGAASGGGNPATAPQCPPCPPFLVSARMIGLLINPLDFFGLVVTDTQARQADHTVAEGRRAVSVNLPCTTGELVSFARKAQIDVDWRTLSLLLEKHYGQGG